MSSRLGGNATPKGKNLLKRNSTSRSASSKSNSTGSKKAVLLENRQCVELTSSDIIVEANLTAAMPAARKGHSHDANSSH
jgi:hypothetical protein